ncbi:hypothetical protein BGY98DRAFT_945824, partial [Russula aff. rugulosa BPL654]
RNPFPSPPSHYTNYTTHNLQLFSLLKERTEGQNASELSQIEILSDQTDVPEWPLTSLEKHVITSNAPPDWHRQVEWITVLAQNIMAAANDLRPVQARASLELMMKRQLELRREETRAIHEKCDSLEAQLAQLRDMARQDSVQPPSEQTGNNVYAPTIEATPFLLLPVDDVARWAEEL